MITFNTPSHRFENVNYANVNEWLTAFYTSHNNGKMQNNDQNININSLQLIQQKMSFSFKSINQLIQALTHRSFFYENKKIVESDNEKLEFLGDSVLNFIISKYLYRHYPYLSEGELSKMRGSLVNEESLANLARSLDLSSNLFLGKGELKNRGFERSSILADAFEAVLGAILIESDFETVEKVFWQIIYCYETETNKAFVQIHSLNDFDPKSKLQEIAMEKWGLTPRYEAVEKGEGFQVELWLGDKRIHAVEGSSKKKCEKELARFAIENNL